MKKLILILITITPLLSFAQQTAGKIIYTETIHLELDIPEEHRQMMGNLPTSQSVEKILYFNKNESLFRDAPENEDKTYEAGSEDSDVQIKVVFASPENLCYKNLSTNQRVEQQEFFGKKFLIEDALETFTWKLTNEQKVIQNYPCTKAVYQDSTIHVAAWFTSQIPVSNGPENYGQLPGMILELNIDEGQRTYIAKSVSLEAPSVENLEAPDKGKKVNAAEFEQIVREKTKEMEAEMGGNGMMIKIRN